MLDAYPVSREITDKEIKIGWSDGHQSIHYHKFLREACPCAACKGESGLFGRQFYAPPPMSIPDDIKPLKLEQVGRYAINIHWSDGHSTGIYTFEYLRELCQCDQCKSKRP